MEICYDDEGLADYLVRTGAKAGVEIYLDRFLENAIEIDVDALADGETVHIGAIMQHVEEAGVHSGDSACVIPAMSLGQEMLRQVEEATSKLALGLGVVGLINIQFAVVRRRPVRDRGQPARLAHGAVRLEGGRHRRWPSWPRA